MPALRTSTGRVQWPSPAALEGTKAGQELSALRDETDKLAAEMGQVKRELESAEKAGRAAAEEADRAAYGQAIRAGEPDPGPVNVTANEAKVRDLRRRQAALEEAIRSVDHDVLAALRSHGGAFEDDAEQLEATAKAELRGAVHALAKAAQTWSARRELLLWLDGDRAQPLPLVSGLTHGIDGQAYGMTAVIAALREAVEG